MPSLEKKGTRAHQDHFVGSQVLVLSSLMSSILIILCHTVVYTGFLLLTILTWLSDPHPSDLWDLGGMLTAYIWESDSRDRRVFWLILASDQNVADLILGIHCHMLSIHNVLPCTNVLLRNICWLVLETFIGQLAEEDWYRASEAYPLKDIVGERLSTL